MFVNNKFLSAQASGWLHLALIFLSWAAVGAILTVLCLRWGVPVLEFKLKHMEINAPPVEPEGVRIPFEFRREEDPMGWYYLAAVAALAAAMLIVKVVSGDPS